MPIPFFVGRFIPAPAGNSLCGCQYQSHHPVHPRACGELARFQKLLRGSGGSSPRLRGTLGSQVPGVRLRRFIPAPAGNSERGRRRVAVRPVHPRACGELRCVPVLNWLIFGSSPRLRGTPCTWLRLLLALRFIPAPAGNSAPVAVVAACAPVHPRACGELYFGGIDRRVKSGSSPRLRGTRRLGCSARAQLRFIPAPAGNSLRTLFARRPVPVHPRACGELSFFAHVFSCRYGSSPRLRGTLFLCSRLLLPLRFIPAPAGNSP